MTELVAPCVQHYYHICIFCSYTANDHANISPRVKQLNVSLWSISSWGFCWLNNEKVISLQWLHPQASVRNTFCCAAKTLSYIFIIYLISNICRASKIVSVLVWVEWVRRKNHLCSWRSNRSMLTYSFPVGQVCNTNTTFTAQSSHKQAFRIRQTAHQCQNGWVRIYSSETTVLHMNVLTDCTVNPLKGSWVTGYQQH